MGVAVGVGVAVLVGDGVGDGVLVGGLPASTGVAMTAIINKIPANKKRGANTRFMRHSP
jgi:hypothetical protein